MSDFLATSGAPDPAPGANPDGSAGNGGGAAPGVEPSGGAPQGGTPQGGTPQGGADPGAGHQQQQQQQQQTPAANSFPDNWRQIMAGDDAAYLKTLERYSTPADFAKAARELRAKVSSGQLRLAKPGEAATAEELAEWRKANDIPDKPEGYFEKLELPAGVVLGEADKPFADDFARYAHEADMTPKQVSKAMQWYYDMQDRAKVMQEQADGQAKLENRDVLVREWGPDFKPNMNAAHEVAGMMPPEVRDRLFAGRTADGKIIGNDPAILQWLSAIGRELNPASTLVPPGSTNPGKSIDDRLGEIRQMMRDDRRAYDKNEAVQKEYRELLTAKEKLQARNA